MIKRKFVLKDNPKTYIGPTFLKENSDIVILDLSDTKIGYLPPEIALLKDLEELNLSNTSLQQIPIQIGSLTKLEKLNIENTPMLTNSESAYNLLKLTNSEELLNYLKNAMLTRPELPPYTYIPIDPPKSDQQFSFFSWNILANHAIRPFLYCLCQEKYLDKYYRENLILEKTLKLMPDIICFQEIEYDQIQGKFLQNFLSKGYSWAYAPKARFNTKHPMQRGPIPGQATLFNLSKFDLLSYNMLEVRNSRLLKDPTPDMINCDDTVLFVLLRTKKTNPVKNILIINVHMFYKLREVREVFAPIIFQEAVYFAQWYVRDFEIIITGDFNDVIEETPVQLFLKSDPRFISVYDEMKQKEIVTFDKTPSVTCRIDHIIATDGLKPVATLSGMTDEEVQQKCPYVPSEFHPSDHFPVGAIFEVQK